MRYLESKFSVGSPGTKAYADSWDRIFAPKPAKNEQKHSSPQARRTGSHPAVDVSVYAPCDVVSVEVTAGYPGGGVAGKGPVGGVGLPKDERGVSGFPDLKAAGDAR